MTQSSLFLRLLLLLYPASFRHEYGTEMERIYSARLRESNSVIGKLLLYAELTVEVLSTAAATHWDLLIKDVRYTARTWLRSPGFAIAALTITALGIGATTAAFTLTDRLLLRPLPYRDVDRLALVWEDLTPSRYSQMEPSPANYRDWKRLSNSFSDMAASRPLSVGLTGNGEPQQIEGAGVTANLLPLLGVQPLLGRLFTSDDDKPGAPGTILLSFRTWKARFAGDKTVLGRTLLLDGSRYTVIGVLPQSFSYPRRAVELWTAMRFAADDFADRNDNYLRVLGKLKPGVTLASARSEMAVVAAELRRAYPKENEHVSASVISLGTQVPSQSRLLLLALFGAASCVLLIACANLANLLLARALSRRKEIAIRTALGAGRERLLRQLLTESLLLACGGGALGVGLAAVLTPFLVKLVPDSFPIAGMPSMDGRVALFALAITVGTGLVFGLAPALQMMAGSATSGLSEGGRGGVGGRRERLRQLLVTAEIGISLLLVVTCGLLLRALWHLNAIDPGFNPANVLTLRTVLPMPRYEKTAVRLHFYDDVLSQIKAIPGVQSASYISFLPIVVRGGIWPVTLPGQDASVDAAIHQATLRYITPDYFKTLSIPLLEGRSVDLSDTGTSSYVAVVSQSFAREYWPGQDPIGRHFNFGFSDRRVIGVVGDVQLRGREAGKSEPQVYVSWQQVPDNTIVWYAPKDLAVRSALRTDDLLRSIRRIISSVDPAQPISDVQTMDEIMADESASRVTQARLLGGFAIVALLLAIIGIHGLLSFTVSRRREEIGVRMALGATTAQVLAMILAESATLCTIGVGIGLLLSLWAGHTLSSLLVGLTPLDGPTYAVALLIALLAGAGGSMLPAWKAVRIDPAIALRAE